MKTVNKTFNNDEIYQIAVELLNSFSDSDQNTYLPAAVAFSIQKNKAAILNLANDIENHRINILTKYSINIEGDQLQIDPEKVNDANKELKDLLEIEQEIKVYTFKIEEIMEVRFTPAQMNAILFMIDEE